MDPVIGTFSLPHSLSSYMGNATDRSFETSVLLTPTANNHRPNVFVRSSTLPLPLLVLLVPLFAAVVFVVVAAANREAACHHSQSVVVTLPL